MRRGEIAIVADRAGGDYAGKPRPAIIVQADVFDGTESVVVCPLTTRARDAELLRVPVKPSAALNLTRSSWIMVDKLTSVRRDRVTHVIGRPSDEEILTFNRSLAVFLGFG